MRRTQERGTGEARPHVRAASRPPPTIVETAVEMVRSGHWAKPEVLIIYQIVCLSSHRLSQAGVCMIMSAEEQEARPTPPPPPPPSDAPLNTDAIADPAKSDTPVEEKSVDGVVDNAKAGANDAGVADGADGADGVRRRRKRSRWGAPVTPSTNADNAEAVLNDAEEKKERKRRSRWGKESDKVALTPQMAAATASMDPKEREIFLCKCYIVLNKNIDLCLIFGRYLLTVNVRMRDVNTKLLNVKSLIPEDPAKRSPSPPPKYDQNGVRTNVREQRIRERLMAERHELIEKLMKLNPAFQSPSDYKKKYEAVLPIPVEKYPGFNFKGLIIGPRGTAQKRMEKETNCRIMIRGKGAVKMKRGRPPHPSDDEPIHVYIVGESQESLDNAVKIMTKLLNPVDADTARRYDRQLKEVATINGTWREAACRICGESGHPINACPKRTGPSWSQTNVMCEICMSRSHPTIDCPTGGTRDEATAQKLSSEYSNFMAELAGQSVPSPPADTQPTASSSAAMPPPSASSNSGAAVPPPPPATASATSSAQPHVHPDRLAQVPGAHKAALPRPPPPAGRFPMPPMPHWSGHGGLPPHFYGRVPPPPQYPQHMRAPHYPPVNPAVNPYAHHPPVPHAPWAAGPLPPPPPPQ